MTVVREGQITMSCFLLFCEFLRGKETGGDKGKEKKETGRVDTESEKTACAMWVQRYVLADGRMGGWADGCVRPVRSVDESTQWRGGESEGGRLTKEERNGGVDVLCEAMRAAARHVM